MPVEEQVLVLYAATKGMLDDIALHDVVTFEKEYLAYMRANYAEIARKISDEKKLDASLEEAIIKAANEFKEIFLAGDKSRAKG